MRVLILLLFFCSTAFAQEVISKQNLSVDVEYKADGVKFYMVNLRCADINTVLPNIKNCTFIRSNITNCVLDSSNVFEQSNYLPEYSKPTVEKDSYEELESRVIQLENFISSKNLAIPTKVTK